MGREQWLGERTIERRSTITLTIQQIIDPIVATVLAAPWDGSVDVFKSGDPTREVTGIVSIFIASIPVLGQAIAVGAHVIMTHEPTCYDHRDQANWLKNDPIYVAKRRFMEEHDVVIWRFHDHQPDGIVTGVVCKLGWDALEQDGSPSIV